MGNVTSLLYGSLITSAWEGGEPGRTTHLGSRECDLILSTYPFYPFLPSAYHQAAAKFHHELNEPLRKRENEKT